MALESLDVAEQRRSRLSPERERELFAAVLDLVREVGYDALTMDAIAARTHSSKATLYRQWRSKPELVATALARCERPSIADVDTGSLAEDLRGMARWLGEELPSGMELMRALGHASEQDEELRTALRGLVVEPELAKLRLMVARAVRRGELKPDNPALGFVAEMLLGGLAGRWLVEGLDADADYLLRYVDAVIIPALDLS